MQLKKIPDSHEAFTVKPIAEQAAIQGYKKVLETKKDEQRSSNPFRSKKKVKDYFKTLARAAQTANEQLEKRHSHYRFRVYKRGERVMIELVFDDASGNKKVVLTKDITNEDFRQWIDDIVNIEGLIIDKRG